MKKTKTDIDKIFKLYYRSLCMYILHYVHDIDAAEDIAQDCFTAFWENTAKENIVIAVYRSIITPSDLEDILTDDETEERSVIEARMWTAIDVLPERCREIFLLNKRDGMKYKEIAEKLQISVNTVDNHINKALRLIREGIHKTYIFIFN